MHSRVGTLKIHLRVPPELADSSSQLQRSVERDLMVRVLEELEQLLHAEHGRDTVIRIRRLALRWQLGLDELVTPELVTRLARDLSRGIQSEVARMAPRERLRPRPDTIAVFENAAHATAAALADHADDLPTHWVHGSTTAETAWQTTTTAGPTMLAAVVAWLVRMERLEGAVALAPEPVLAALVEHVPDAAPQVALVRARRAVAGARPAAAPQARPTVPATPSTSAEVPSQRAPSTSDLPAVALADADAVAPPTSAAQAVPPHAAAPRTDAEPAPTAPVAAHDRAPIDAVEAETAFAGIFYLAARALEIELAEQLWAAGLPEGRVLAHVAAVLLGDLQDPAWRWFGGAFDEMPAMPPVPAWAATEVLDHTQHALGRRLVRFGVSQTPAALSAQLDHLAGALAPAIPLEPTAARIVTRSAAALVAITCARLEVTPSVTAVCELCARSGRLVRTPDELHVVISSAYADVKHRRAGLDHDPGYVAWLKRKVRIELVGAESL